MIDAILFGFDMPVEHGAVGMEAELMRSAGNVEPLRARDFVIANDAPHAIAENLGAAAGEGIHARVFQLQKRVANAKLRALREKSDLHHGERLQVHLWKTLLQA